MEGFLARRSNLSAYKKELGRGHACYLDNVTRNNQRRGESCVLEINIDWWRTLPAYRCSCSLRKYQRFSKHGVERHSFTPQNLCSRSGYKANDGDCVAG